MKIAAAGKLLDTEEEVQFLNQSQFVGKSETAVYRMLDIKTGSSTAVLKEWVRIRLFNVIKGKPGGIGDQIADELRRRESNAASPR
jgi:hypothetical protein